MMEQPIRADANRALSRALGLRVGGARILTSTSRPWASVTFTGARHTISLLIEGAESARRAAGFIDGIDVAEFNLPGHILADISVAAVRHEPAGSVIELEALTVEDA